MKIPKKIKIGPHWVKVRFKKTLHLNGTPALGISDQDHLTIDLVKEYNGKPIPESKLWANFFHEVFHHLLWVTPFDLEEEQVLLLGDLLFQVLHDNDLGFTGKSEK